MSLESPHQYLEKYAASRPQIPQDLRLQYETALGKVLRWQDAESPSRKVETDLDHVNSSIGIVDEIEEFFPKLAGSIDLDTVRDIIYIHDAGEIVANDLPRSHPSYWELRDAQKQKERIGFGIISRRIDDSELKARARQLYARYENYQRNDPEAAMAKLIDKIQAVRFALVHVYDMTRARDPEERARYLRQANVSVDLIFEFAGDVFEGLDKNAAGEFSTFLQLELGKYRIAGYPEIHLEARNRLLRMREGQNGRKMRLASPKGK